MNRPHYRYACSFHRQARTREPSLIVAGQPIVGGQLVVAFYVAGPVRAVVAYALTTFLKARYCGPFLFGDLP